MTTREIPQVSVRYGAGSAQHEIADVTVELRIQHRLSFPSLCELVCAVSERELDLQIGTAIAVSIPDDAGPLFNGTVTSLVFESSTVGQASMRIRAYDRTHDLRQKQTVRDFAAKSSRDIISEIAADIGLPVDMRGTGPLWHHIVQLRENDFEFLQRIAERSGLYFSLEGEELRIVTAQGAGAPVLLSFQADIIEIRVEQNTSRSCKSVETNGWDPWLSKQNTAIATQPGVTGGGDALEPGNLAVRLFGMPLQSVEQAHASAQNELDYRSAEGRTAWGTVHGNSNLRVGARIGVTDAPPGFKGEFVLSSVTHTIDARNGFITEFDSSLPEPAPRKEHTEVTMGKVISVRDPEKLGRARLQLPFHGDVQTDWLQVVLPAAGHDKGFIALPDVGDQVLVLLVSADPSQGLILGGVFGMDAPKELGVDGNKVRRFFLRTPGGQQILLDDGDGSVHLTQKDGARMDLSGDEIELKTADGSYLSMKKNRVVLHSKSDLTIEAPGKDIRIAGNAIDFDRM